MALCNPTSKHFPCKFPNSWRIQIISWHLAYILCSAPLNTNPDSWSMLRIYQVIQVPQKQASLFPFHFFPHDGTIIDQWLSGLTMRGKQWDILWDVVVQLVSYCMLPWLQISKIGASRHRGHLVSFHGRLNCIPNTFLTCWVINSSLSFKWNNVSGKNIKCNGQFSSSTSRHMRWWPTMHVWQYRNNSISVETVVTSLINNYSHSHVTVHWIMQSYSYQLWF